MKSILYSLFYEVVIPDEVVTQDYSCKVLTEKILKFIIKYAICTCANVAQVVEQFTRNEQAAGSSPAISSKKVHRTVSLFIFIFFVKIAEIRRFESEFCYNYIIKLIVSAGLAVFDLFCAC